MLKSKYIYLLFVVIISFSISSHAKWAQFEDAETKTTINNSYLTINKDGTSEEIVENEFEILRESAREKASQYLIRYNGDSEKLVIIEAKTILKDKTYKVDPKYIEDKPLASASNGFDQYRQILIAFPKLEIGSKIYIKYKFISLNPSLDKFFSVLYDFGYRDWTTSANVKIDSKIPLHIMVNDPENSLKIKKDKEDNFYHLDISLTKPIYKEEINEPQNAIKNYKNYTWVSLSASNNWEDLAKQFSEQNFNHIYTEELPKDFKEIADLAKNKENIVDQINFVTSALNDHIQYLSDRTTVHGRISPRSLSEVSQSQLGDCKDFSAATVAILTNLGYQAQFALVARGEGDFPLEALPRVQAFDHVIVKVTDKKGKIYWIDPTNIQSMAEGIFPDIANKKALVLDPINPLYETIPNVNPNHAVSIHKKELELLTEDKVKVSGTCILRNEEAIPLTAIELFNSKENLADSVLNLLSGATLDDHNQKQISLPDLSSRIVKDININYSYIQDNKLTRTNLGNAFNLNYNINDIEDYIDIPNDTVSDIYLGAPYTIERETIIKNAKAKNIESLNKELDSKWIYISRNLTIENNNLVIKDRIVSKRDVIKNEELKTLEFKTLKTNIERNFKNSLVIID